MPSIKMLIRGLEEEFGVDSLANIIVHDIYGGEVVALDINGAYFTVDRVEAWVWAETCKYPVRWYTLHKGGTEKSGTT